MKALSEIHPGKTEAKTMTFQKSIKGFQYLLTMFLMVFLLMISIPSSGSTKSGKERKSACRARNTVRSYPVIITKKNSPVMFNTIKKSRTRNFSFPV